MSEVKKLCIVSAQYLPHTGGVENYVANLTRELGKRGHQVTILTSCAEPEVQQEKTGNVEVIRLPSRMLMGGRFPFLKHGKALKRFTKEFRKREFDLMFVNVRFYPISLYAVKLAKRMKLRCILMDHGSGHVNTGSRLTTLAGKYYEHMITAIEKKYCHEFACVSKEGTGWVKHFGIETDTVLPNAVSVERFEWMKAMQARNFREEYGIPDSATVIAFVGRLTVEKGIEELVDAVSRIGRDDLWLIAAGEGYLDEKLEQKGLKNLRLTGKIPSEEVVSLLMQSDIFCLPSVSEGFPTTVLEAIMCKTFVITTRCGDAKEIIKSNEFGLILDDNRVEGLTEAIRSVLDCKEYRTRAAERCYYDVIEHYTWEKTADKLLALLDNPGQKES